MDLTLLAQQHHAEAESAPGLGCFVIVYLIIIMGAAIFVLVMLWRFVRAHEKIAESQQELARSVESLAVTYEEKSGESDGGGS
jgi:hypothetical protein